MPKSLAVHEPCSTANRQAFCSASKIQMSSTIGDHCKGCHSLANSHLISIFKGSRSTYHIATTYSCWERNNHILPFHLLSSSDQCWKSFCQAATEQRAMALPVTSLLNSIRVLWSDGETMKSTGANSLWHVKTQNENTQKPSSIYFLCCMCIPTYFYPIASLKSEKTVISMLPNWFSIKKLTISSFGEIKSHTD